MAPNTPSSTALRDGPHALHRNGRPVWVNDRAWHPNGQPAWDGHLAYHTGGRIAWVKGRAIYASGAAAYRAGYAYHPDGTRAWSPSTAPLRRHRIQLGAGLDLIPVHQTLFVFVYGMPVHCCPLG